MLGLRHLRPPLLLDRRDIRCRWIRRYSTSMMELLDTALEMQHGGAMPHRLARTAELSDALLSP